jgi:hypothetical protein
VLDGYVEGKLDALLKRERARARRGLSAEEVALVQFLKAAARK